MLIRTVFLYLNYLKCRIIYKKRICFRGFSVICALKNSSITFPANGEKVNIYFHPFSNMIGLQQRCIIVAKFGGKINIEEGVCMSGCTVYSIDSISIGKHSDIGPGCKIIDNDFHALPYSQRYPEQLE